MLNRYAMVVEHSWFGPGTGNEYKNKTNYTTIAHNVDEAISDAQRAFSSSKNVVVTNIFSEEC